MAYCKWCGMESKDPAKCEWCGRPFAVPTPGTEPTQVVQPPEPPPAVVAAREKIEALDRAENEKLTAFFVSAGVVILAASILILVRWTLYPLAIIVSLFVAGMLLGYFGIIPPFEHEWAEFGVPLLLILILPALIVYLGYLAYGLVTRQMDLTVVWLLSVYFGMLVVMEIVTFIALPDRVPADNIWKLRGAEFLGLLAVLFGWITSGSIRRSSG